MPELRRYIGCVAAMAALSLILEERKRQSGQAQRESFSSKVRLVADPTTSVAGLAKAFRQYLEHHKSEDLWALIMPAALWATFVLMADVSPASVAGQNGWPLVRPLGTCPEFEACLEESAVELGPLVQEQGSVVAT